MVQDVSLPLHAQEVHGLPSRQPLKFVSHDFCLKGNNKQEMLLSLSHWEKLWRRFQRCEGLSHLKGSKVRCGQVAQVVLGGSVSSGLLLHQRCSLEAKRLFGVYMENTAATEKLAKNGRICSFFMQSSWDHKQIIFLSHENMLCNLKTTN